MKDLAVASSILLAAARSAFSAWSNTLEWTTSLSGRASYASTLATVSRPRKRV